MQDDRPGYYGADQNPTPDHWWQRLTEIWALLARADSRAERANDLRTYVDEYLYQQGVQSCTLQRTTDNPVLVERLIVYTDQASATVKIGTLRQFTINGGFQNLGLAGVIIKPSDVVTVTTPTAGQLFVEMTGTQLPVTSL